jgi:RNA polymerase sigma factor (sigma-70 family)
MAMASTWIEADFESIFREHFARMVYIARRVLRSDAEAEEICAETFLTLYRSGPGVLSGGALGAWLYRVATRASIDRLRRNQRRGLEEELETSRIDPADDTRNDPLNTLIRDERIAEVRSTLAQMKSEKAQLLLLRHSGLSYQEIAEALQIRTASVGTMLARAETEFSTLYQRRQRLNKRAPRLQAAKEG